MISESSMIIENSDAAFAIVREYNTIDGNSYLGIKELKSRSSTNGPSRNSVYFAHPFEPGNGMRLQEDYGLEKEEFSVDSISGGTMGVEEVESEPAVKGRSKRNVAKKSAKSLIEEYE